jgi:serralysin
MAHDLAAFLDDAASVSGDPPPDEGSGEQPGEPDGSPIGDAVDGGLGEAAGLDAERSAAIAAGANATLSASTGVVDVEGFASLGTLSVPVGGLGALFALPDAETGVTGTVAPVDDCGCPFCATLHDPTATPVDSDGPQHNGSGATATSVAASGNQGIDGLLSSVRWNNTLITYSNPDSPADYQAGHPEAFSNFSQFSAQQMVAVHFALNSAIFTQPVGAAGFGVEGFTNLGIDYAGAGSGAGTIRVANTSDPNTVGAAAYAYYPSNGVAGGDAFFGVGYRSPTAGNFDWFAVLHELGHSLGLKHGHETNVFGAMPAGLLGQEFSVMPYRSYVGSSGFTNEFWGFAQTFMMYDIAALQYMYGADYTTNSGNTVYTWSPTTGQTFVNGNVAINPGANRIFATIWDGGGIDTYDLSNYTTNLTLDLNAGGWSTFSTAQLADLDAGSADPARVARGNIANALLFNGNTASLIENAIGGSGNDIIYGNQVANTLTGNGGNDQLYGGSGEDVLYGGAGNDGFNGGLFVDQIYGGAGDDLVSIFGGDFIDDIFGGSGVDTLSMAGYTFAAVNVDLDAGTYTTGGAEGAQTILDVEIVVGTNFNDTMTGTWNTQTFYGGAGNDTFISLAGRFYDAVYGGTGTDTLNHAADSTGGSTFDFEAQLMFTSFASSSPLAMQSIEIYFDGTGGNTIISAGNGNTLYGGGGDDVMRARFGAETFYGGAGWDILDLSFGDVQYIFDMTTNVPSNWSTIERFEGFEEIWTGGAQDTIWGTAGVNIIRTGGGNDTLYGGGGRDSLYGGDGDDLMVYVSGEGYDDYYGGAGIDTVILQTFSTAPFIVDLAAGTYSDGTPFSAAIQGVENVQTGDNDDVITGSKFANSILASGGDDSIFGFGGSDTIYGGSGNDILEGGTAQDFLYGGADNDQLYGGSNADTLYGGSGNDLLDGGAGADWMYGGLGDDTFYVNNGGDRVFEDAASGIDQILSSVSFNLSTGAPEVENLTLLGGGSINGTGSAAANVITGNGADNRLIGLDGDDILSGGAGNDSLNGGNGNDSLNGGNGNDSLAGLAGNDVLNGGAGDDAIDGGAGNDTLTGAAGNDTLAGGAGSDTFVFAGNFGIDRIIGFSVADPFEVIDLSGVAAITSFADLVANHLSQGVDGAVITANANTITLVGVLASSLTASEFIF